MAGIHAKVRQVLPPFVHISVAPFVFLCRAFSPISTFSASGLGLTSTAVKKGNVYALDIGSQYKYKNAILDVKVDTDSNISTTLIISEILPYTKAITSLKLPDVNSGKGDNYAHRRPEEVCNALVPLVRHIIRRDIMLYPGYVPETGSSIRVFHYGLRFSVGNWSFDKADWRYTDVVNTCWAKFPEPPDPSSITTADPDEKARDLLSIECAKALNTALNLHHQRRKCSSNSEDVNGGDSTGERMLEDKSQVDAVSLDANSSLNTSTVVDRPETATRSNMKWIVALWGISVLGFFYVICVVLSGRKKAGSRPRSSRNKKR